jgi:hypothetical protein
MFFAAVCLLAQSGQMTTALAMSAFGGSANIAELVRDRLQKCRGSKILLRQCCQKSGLAFIVLTDHDSGQARDPRCT